MKGKMNTEQIRWVLIAVSVSGVLILSEFCLNNCPINDWNATRWFTAAIIIAAFVLAVLLCGGKDEN